MTAKTNHTDGDGKVSRIDVGIPPPGKDSVLIPCRDVFIVLSADTCELQLNLVLRDLMVYIDRENTMSENNPGQCT